MLGGTLKILPVYQDGHSVLQTNLCPRAESVFSRSHDLLAASRILPVIVEPVDDSAGFQVELGGEFFDGFW